MATLPEISFKYPPMDHQRKALDLSYDMVNYAYFMDMGTGKSKVFIDLAAMLFKAGKIDGVLLLAPKGVYMNWIDDQLPSHWPADLPGMWTYWASPSKPPLEAEWKKLAAFKGCQWLCVNVEALAYERGRNFAGSFANKHKGRFLIGVDESTMIKNGSALRTKWAITIGRLAAYRRIMSGDPIPKAPTDLYSQCQFLHANCLGFSSYYAFRARYCELVERSAAGRSFKQIVGYKNLDELNTRLKGFSYRVLKDECVDLPPKVYQTRDVELTDEQKSAYNQMAKQCCMLIGNGGLVTADIAITQLLRLHQIVCGHTKLDTGEEVPIPNRRLDALMEVIDETSGKVIIWANYRTDIKQIVAALRKEYGEDSTVHFYGDTDNEERRFARLAFQNHANVRFFVSNPATGKFGLTLTASCTAVYYSNSYDLEHRTQSEDRIHRIGQTASKVTYVDLVVRNTVDQKILKALRSKKHIGQIVMGDPQTAMDWFKTV
jgi:hypothetical protein